MSFYGQPVAIAGDATVYCLDCAERTYGEKTIAVVLNGPRDDLPPTDREGNELCALLSGQDVGSGPDKLSHCDVCGASLLR